MGVSELFSKLFDKKKKQENKAQEPDLPPRPERESGRVEQTISMEALSVPEHQIISPAVEHPLLTIQERMLKIEELYRSINEKLANVDGKVATKEDVDDIKALLHEDIVKEDRILTGIGDIHARIGELEERKESLTRQVEEKTRQLTEDVEELEQVSSVIGFLEADKKIIDVLEGRKMSTIELSEALGFSRQYLWERLKELKTAGYVSTMKRGRQTKYFLLKKIEA